LADLYRRIVLRRATGAFNAAAEPLLTGERLAAILDHGRVVEIPASVVRPVVSLAWQAHALASDAGWLDMGMNVPVMDASRARRALGWEPRSGAEAGRRGSAAGRAGGRG